MSDQQNEREEQEEKEAVYESTPEELTGFKKGSGGPPWFDRKKVLMTLSIAFAGIVIVGVAVSGGKSSTTQGEEENSGYAANVPRDFLNQELERSRLANSREEETSSETALSLPGEIPDSEEETLPQAVPVSLAENPSRPQERGQYPERSYPPPSPSYAGNPSAAGSQAPPANPYASSLVARLEGNLFASPPQAAPLGTATAATQTGRAEYPGYPYSEYPGTSAQQYPVSYPSYAIPQAGNGDAYTQQNNQADKSAFYNSASGGSPSGNFLQENLLWIGTIIPAVLETSVNTDLPGNVIARVTENIFDSQTGTKMLIPQGTLLVAKYNNSVSYAQHRVQIVWDQMIRPDGYYLELEGMNGVDERGMSGIKADYHENWFEYVKAAGIITMFSLANSSLAGQVAKYGSNDMAAAAVSSNAEFMQEVSGNVVSKAMNIQPTLIVKNGEKINVMLNKNLRLPPLKNYPVTKKYSLSK